jgi:hypothetical protein
MTLRTETESERKSFEGRKSQTLKNIFDTLKENGVKVSRDTMNDYLLIDLVLSETASVTGRSLRTIGEW